MQLSDKEKSRAYDVLVDSIKDTVEFFEVKGSFAFNNKDLARVDMLKSILKQVEIIEETLLEKRRERNLEGFSKISKEIA